MSNGILQDTNGNWSSKRLGGLSMIFTGIGLAIANVWLQSEMISTQLWPIFTTGAALLGASVAERKQ